MEEKIKKSIRRAKKVLAVGISGLVLSAIGLVGGMYYESNEIRKPTIVQEYYHAKDIAKGLKEINYGDQEVRNSLDESSRLVEKVVSDMLDKQGDKIKAYEEKRKRIENFQKGSLIMGWISTLLAIGSLHYVFPKPYELNKRD